jgi:hypothetical protein
VQVWPPFIPSSPWDRAYTADRRGEPILLDRPEALRYLRPKLSRQDNAGRKALLSVRIAAPLLLACWFWGCAATRVAETGEPDGGPAGRLEAALERAVDDGATRDSLHLLVECRRERGAGSVELFGNGVGIWNGRRQFRAAAPVVTAALEALRDHGFAAMPEGSLPHRGGDRGILQDGDAARARLPVADLPHSGARDLEPL